MSMQNWPKQDRPRERLIRQGPQSLSDSELLAIFLRTGLPGKSAVDLAREIINQFGSLQQLNQVTLAQWCSVPGLGEAKFAQFKACLEMASRCLNHQLQEINFLSRPDLLESFVRAQIGISPVEKFLVIALDSQLKVIQHQIIAEGTVNKTAVFPREVLRFAIENNAPRLMVAHNHPSGHCQPSQADDHLTQTLHDAMLLMDIELVDHLIVSGCASFSYRTQGRKPF